MKYMTSGDIHRMFKQEDEGTIIRRNNVRRIALENGIKNTLTQNIILIDSKDFFEKVNPYDLQAHEYKIPKLRCIKDCAREWNKHRKTGDRFIHTDEIRDFLKTDTTVFNTLFIYLLKQITAAIFRRTVKIYNTYGFSISNIEKERGTMDGKAEKKKYYVMNKKIYSRRFSTDCFSDYFNDLARKTGVGLEDYLEYETEKATVDELKMQNSYFINALYKNTDSKESSADNE